MRNSCFRHSFSDSWVTVSAQQTCVMRLCDLRLYGDASEGARHAVGLEFSGPIISDLGAPFMNTPAAGTYLEIGVDEGGSLEIVRPETLDAGYRSERTSAKTSKAPTAGIRQTSDDFSRNDVTFYWAASLGSRLHDGMHQFEFALRDFFNVERHCSADSIILIHDVYPIDAISAGRERVSNFWSGDIWRLISC